MAHVIPFDRHNPVNLLRSSIDSINKSIMFYSVDIIKQSGHLKRLYEIYDKVFDFVFLIINGMIIEVPEVLPGGWEIEDWLAFSLAQTAISFCFTNNVHDHNRIYTFLNHLYNEARSWVGMQCTWYPEEDIGY